MRIDTTLIPQPLVAVAQLFARNSYQLRPVGGCVRDALRGLVPKDWDCATDALPQQTFNILDKAGCKPFDISNGHGTVSFIADGETYEITTLRLDVETDGRHAAVKFVTDFQADAARRDFTFNAMSCDPFTGEVFDYFDGVGDISAGSVRFVGDPLERIVEDKLRMLRYFRFIGRMGFFTLDSQSFDAIRQMAYAVNDVSGERIWMEISQILTNENKDRVIRLMFETGVAQHVGLVYPANYVS